MYRKLGKCVPSSEFAVLLGRICSDHLLDQLSRHNTTRESSIQGSGYREIRVKFKIKGDVDKATVQELVRKSPIFDTLTNPVKMKVEVEKM